MGFDFGDIWNPIEQATDLYGGGKDIWNGVTHPGWWGKTGTNPNQIDDQRGALAYDQTGQPTPWQIDDQARQRLLAQQAGIAGKFADQSEKGYAAYGAQGQDTLDALRAQAQGRNSVSAEQLRQSLEQNVAHQRSLAAGASPRNAAMAARTASIQTGRLGAGMAGQQAIAGLQERNQAQQQYGSLLQGLRGQDLSAALTSRQNATSGYGAGNTGNPQKSWIETYGPAITAGASYVASDRRLKTDVSDGSDKADTMLAALRAKAYRYRDGKQHGEGDHVGPMAQDLERAGSRAVIDTPGGKMVHGARLATENTAMLAALRDRVAKLERGKGR